MQEMTYFENRKLEEIKQKQATELLFCWFLKKFLLLMSTVMMSNGNENKMEISQW